MATNHQLEQDRDALVTIRQLERRYRQIMREVDAPFVSRHNEFHEIYGDLLVDKNMFDQAYVVEKRRIQQHVEKLSQNIQTFSKEVRHLKPDLTMVNKIRTTIEDLEQTIYTSKEASRLKYEELTAEERLLSNEIQALNEKIELWSTQRPGQQPQRSESVPPTGSARKLDSSNSNLLPEIIEYDKFLLDRGGLNGGWDEYDHGTFLRIRNKYKGQEKFIDDCVGFLPTKTRDQIDEHEQWYREFLKISNKRRLALKRWREDKNHAKETILKEAEHAHQTLKEIDETIQRAQAKEQERQRTERLEALTAWKQQRQVKKRLIDEEKERSELRKQQEDEKRLNEKLEQKKLVEQIRREREELERAEREQKIREQQLEQQIRQRSATSAIRQFRQRDMNNLEEKVLREKLKKEDEENRQRRLESMKYHVNLDYDRQQLYEPTQAWTARGKTPRDESRNHSTPSSILHVPHRATPSWRQ